MNFEKLKSKVLSFVSSCYCNKTGAYSSTPELPVSLYATCYALLLKYYFSGSTSIDDLTADFIRGCQNESGLFIGPELTNYEPAPSATHDMEHIQLHLFITVLPVIELFNLECPHPLTFAERFIDPESLLMWLNQRDIASDPWLEGNNFLFALQILTHLKEKKHPGARTAQTLTFDWLNERTNPHHGLWGPDEDLRGAVYGGYHQLLAYFYEGKTLKHPHQIVDTCLSIQHFDGCFAKNTGGGACEDIDAIDPLVNISKRSNYKRSRIAASLSLAFDTILAQQNQDGGFPYDPNRAFSHMGIPITKNPPEQSNMFATWFRCHTLFVANEVVDYFPKVYVFNPTLSMGWHDTNLSFQKPRPATLKLTRLQLRALLFARKLAHSSRGLLKSLIRRIRKALIR